MANLYLGMQGRLAEVAPKPGHHCCTPAAQLELLLSATAQLCCAEEVTPCIRDHPVHKGPPHAQGTILCTRDCCVHKGPSSAQGTTPCTRDHPPYTRGHPMHRGPSHAQGAIQCTRGRPMHKGPPCTQGTVPCTMVHSRQLTKPQTTSTSHSQSTQLLDVSLNLTNHSEI